MDSTYAQAIKFLFESEGYTSDLKGDPGGLTIWGISQKTWPKEVEAMADMNPEESKAHAIQFYYKNYWIPNGCNALPFPVDMVVFDGAINTGRNYANEYRNGCVGCWWRDLLFRRLAYYCNLKEILRRRFIQGWLNRVISLWKLIVKK